MADCSLPAAACPCQHKFVDNSATGVGGAVFMRDANGLRSVGTTVEVEVAGLTGGSGGSFILPASKSIYPYTVWRGVVFGRRNRTFARSVHPARTRTSSAGSSMCSDCPVGSFSNATGAAGLSGMSSRPLLGQTNYSMRCWMVFAGRDRKLRCVCRGSGGAADPARGGAPS